MKLVLNRSLTIYYSLILTITLAVGGYGFFHFWTNGLFNPGNVASTYEASILLDEIKKKEYVAKINSQVESDRVRDAVKTMEAFEKKATNLEGFNSNSSFLDMKKKLNQNKKYLNTLLNYPELSTVIIILGNKVSSFESLVIQNRWRTLTRMSRRIKARLNISRVRTPGFFNHSKLSALMNSIVNDISTMKNITNSSVLSSNNKEQILTKIRTFNTELTMIKRFLNSLDDFNASYGAFNDSYGIWIKEVTPRIALSRISFEKNNKQLLFGFIGLVGFWLLSLIGGYFLSKRNRNSILTEIEDVSLSVIKNQILPLKETKEFLGGTNFEREVQKYRDYVHKRMSFGTVFQEAVPFSCILLDSNLNIVWANELFNSTWDLKGSGKDGTVSWDYLQKFTNLGDDDPVLMAHEQGIAGIYDIQLRKRIEDDSSPYEMYVSPVEYGGSKRIMIFFYPLTSVEETLQNQTRSIVSPVSKTLEALSNNRFNEEFVERIKSDFEVAGIAEIFNKFKKYYNITTQQNDTYLSEVSQIEGKYYDQQKILNDLKELQNLNIKPIEDGIDNFSKSKESIIHNIDLRYQMEDKFQGLLKLSQLLLKEETSLLVKSEKAADIILENKLVFESICTMRDELKTLKSEVNDFKIRLSQSVEQTMQFLKKEKNDQKLESSLARIKLEVKGVEKVFGIFGDVVKSLDVRLSKVGLIINDTEVPQFDEFHKQMEFVQKELENFNFELGKISRSGERSDDLLVSKLKSLYLNFNQFQEFSHKIEDLIESKEVEIEGISFSNSEEILASIEIENNITASI